MLSAPITIFRLPLGVAAVVFPMSATRAARSRSMRWMLSASAARTSGVSLSKSVIISLPGVTPAQFVVVVVTSHHPNADRGSRQHGDDDQERAMW
jgi:hypothetical protein